MNQGVVHSSVPVQQMVAAATPNWWSINNMKPSSHNQQNSFLTTPPHNYFPGHHHSISSASWNDLQQQEPESWSQLLLGGSVGEVEKPGLSHKRIENWEQQFLNQSSNMSSVVDAIKLENNYTNCWSQSHQMLSSASPKSSCVTTLLLDFTHSSHKSPDPQLPDPSISECNSTSTGGIAKKARIQSSSPHQSTFKVRKEKLGDRITALHQLVSPFGKTDTASVLLEAIGYIRFLQSQVEALSLPYLQGTGTRNKISQPHQVQGNRNCLFPQFPVKESSEEDQDEEEGKKEKKDLKSRGLCLVPISSTLHFGSDNGADYWAPAFGGNFQ